VSEAANINLSGLPTLEMSEAELAQIRPRHNYRNRGTPTCAYSSEGKGVRHNTHGVNAEIENGFYGDHDALYEIKHETHKHRVIISLARQGLLVKEIAERVGMTSTGVSNVLRQPWARIKIVEGIELTTKEKLRQMLEEHGPTCLQRIVDLSASAQSEQVRLAANNAVLDRLLGRPTQPISQEVSKPETLSDDELQRIATSGSGVDEAAGGPSQPTKLV
jgi:lambda repressor-like predicted transcriptional regulator